MYKEETNEKPKNLQIKKPINDVKKICPIPVTKETFPTSLTTEGFKLSPIIKSKKEIPNSEKTNKGLSLEIMLKNKGPVNIPAII